ncbi:inositol monophosphatase family protein [Streptomyces sp. 7-21]|uniref:inositol monophosphatase family protein n=1 Tax=Streptomyces sp. 7-21 TaxID=2802283 RepID=UPI00191EFFBD|nr:inositol monophosphatase family protein [Streptomyces sp. 7-21]MBL1068695.1 inositol monophosphatase family protein [Streptomyces sp. 7-21]
MLNVLNVVSAALNDLSAVPRTERLIAVARDACREAAALLRRRAAEGTRARAKSDYERVSDADVEAEALLRTALRAAVPGSGVVGEELPEDPVQAGPGAPGPAVTWYVDPLDGTHNFLRGLPFACVSVGVAVDGRLVGGCVHDIFRDESFTGGDGVPLRVEGAAGPVAGAAPPDPAQAPLVLTDVPMPGRDGPAEARFFADLVSRAEPRRLYCTALSLAWVAAGRADLACNLPIRPWDVAGGAALVRAAGGRCVPVGGPEVTHAPGFVAVRAEAGEQAERAGHWLQARLTALYLRRDYGR